MAFRKKKEEEFTKIVEPTEMDEDILPSREELDREYAEKMAKLEALQQEKAVVQQENSQNIQPLPQEILDMFEGYNNRTAQLIQYLRSKI